MQSRSVRRPVDENHDVKQESKAATVAIEVTAIRPPFRLFRCCSALGRVALKRIVFGPVHQGFATVEIFAGASFLPFALNEIIEPKPKARPTDGAMEMIKARSSDS
jgi:hypothetical protein